jgi:hypothetical protein
MGTPFSKNFRKNLGGSRRILVWRLNAFVVKFQQLFSIIATFSLLFCSITAEAGPVSLPPVSLPPVNLGDTSFQDGIANRGWFLEETINYYNAARVNNAQGGRIPGSNELTTISAVTHVAYVSKHRVLGGYLGAEVLLPLVDADLSTSFQPQNRARGVGDLIVSPFILQWNDRKLFNMPYFHRFDIALSLPTGQYDANRAVNAGNNIVSLNPYYAFTIVPADKLEISARLHYLWNSENDNPYAGLGASSVQPGQAFHANVAASYEIIRNLRIGINGYALQQFTDDKVNGHSLADSEERVFGVGPGLVFNTDKLWIYLNSYFETGAENRPEGIKITLRISRAF